MNIVLACAPAWTVHSPMVGIALLQSYLKQHGLNPKVLDLHAEFAKEHPLLNKYLTHLGRYYPMRLASFFSNFIIPSNHILDTYCEGIIKSNPHTVCFSIFKQNIFASIYISKQLKKCTENVQIVFGGPGCGFPLLQDFIRKSGCVDHLFTTNADDSVPQLLALLGKESRHPISNNLDEEPIPDFSGFQLDKYSSRQIPYSTTRGCYKRCSFCFDIVYWKRYRRKSAHKVVSDIKELMQKHSIDHFFFADSIMLGDVRNIETFCNLIIEEKIEIKWYGQIRGQELTRNLLEKMKQAGCSSISIGIESGSQRILDLMNKDADINTLEQTVQNAAEVGIKVYGLFIVGYPKETWHEFKMTLEFIKRNRNCLYKIRASVLSILPKTALYEHAQTLGVQNKESFAWHTKGNFFWTRYARLFILKLYCIVVLKNHGLVRRSAITLRG